MPALTAIFLSLALILAVTLGPLTEPWVWGPSLLALAAATISALLDTWKNRSTPPPLSVICLGLLTCGWFAWRAWNSPVAELGHTDLLLLTATICSFFCTSSLNGSPRARAILACGAGLMLAASIVVVAIQQANPGFSPILFRPSGNNQATGFFTHYNYGANFLAVASVGTLATALFANLRMALRIPTALLGLLGSGAVLSTHSRGAALAVGVGITILTACLLVMGYRNKAKWFPAAAITLPIIGLALIGALVFSLQQAQEARTGSDSITEMMDNTSRLMLLGTAMTTISMHPLQGGGSRSFSWESLQAWDHSMDGVRRTMPEFAHNEWMQAATDYGLVGAVLLVITIAFIAISCILRILFSGQGNRINPWHVAGLAGLAATLTQSCFSFVFHLLPGVILLGICMSMASHSSGASRAKPKRIQQVLGSLILIASAAFIALPAWQGTRASAAALASQLGKHKEQYPSPEKITDLDQAIHALPDATLLKRRAIEHHRMAAQQAPPAQLDTLKLAADDYHASLELNPKDGTALTNLANILSDLQLNAQADEAFNKLIALQGSMEGVFRAHYHYGRHLYKTSIQFSSAGQQTEAMDAMRAAAYHCDQAFELTYHTLMGPEGRSLHISSHEILGILLENADQPDAALEHYQTAAQLYGGSGRRIHIRKAILLANQARDIWLQRESQKAYGIFLEARQAIRDARGQLPEGISETQKHALAAKIDNAIKILRTAGIEPEHRQAADE